MGTYATTTGLATMMPDVSFDTATTSLASKAITWAEGMVNGTIAKRYDVSASPFLLNSTTPPLISSLTEELALGYIYRVMSRGAKESLARAKSMIDEAMVPLYQIRDLERDLVDTSGALVTARTTFQEVQCNTDGYPRTFNEDDPVDWAVSSDKLTDIADNERD